MYLICKLNAYAIIIVLRNKLLKFKNLSSIITIKNVIINLNKHLIRKMHYVHFISHLPFTIKIHIIIVIFMLNKK